MKYIECKECCEVLNGLLEKCPDAEIISATEEMKLELSKLIVPKKEKQSDEEIKEGEEDWSSEDMEN